jgi:hypothetical protein
MSNKKILSNIELAIKDYHTNYGISPTKIFFTKDDEVDLIDVSNNFSDKLKSSIFVDGIRKAFEKENNKILGMTISWDANEFKVE